MFTEIAIALFYFLPAYIANAMPVLASRMPFLHKFDLPVDFGISWGKKPLIGKNKTWRGLITGVLGALAVVIVESFYLSFFPEMRWLAIVKYDLPEVLLLGILMGLGEGCGDVIKSLVKRRLGVKSGGAFFPFDQLSFLGALGLAFYYSKVPFSTVLIIIIISPLAPIIANFVAYKIGWKDVWW